MLVLLIVIDSLTAVSDFALQRQTSDIERRTAQSTL